MRFNLCNKSPQVLTRDQDHFLVDQFYLVSTPGFYRSAYVISLDRELPVLFPVYQHTEFHFGRTSVIEQHIEGGFNGASGKQHIINEDYCFVFHTEMDVYPVGGNDIFPDIIPVKSDIELSVRNCFLRMLPTELDHNLLAQ